MFLRDAFPKARHIHYLEFFYRAEGVDVGFDPLWPSSLDNQCRVRLKNAAQMLSFEAADAGITPTAWQKSRYPTDWHARITQLHDGIDTTQAKPDAQASFTINKNSAAAVTLTPADEVLTYVARNLEPYRGFHTFMRSVPLILEQRPKAQILIVGGDSVSYGLKPVDANNYRELYQKDWGKDVDTSRVHFLGRLPYMEYLKVLQVSSLHIYLTYPFVLSWSMLEAMSAGACVLGSATAPVQEVIRDGVNGYLTDFFDEQALAGKAGELLENRLGLAKVREAARQTIVAAYDLRSVCLPKLMEFYDNDV